MEDQVLYPYGDGLYSPNKLFAQVRCRQKHVTNTFEHNGRLYPSIFNNKIALK